MSGPLQPPGFPGSSDTKESAYNTGDEGSIPGSGRSPGERNVIPLQYSCLENPMDRGAWWATVYGVTESQTQISDLHKETLSVSVSMSLSVYIYVRACVPSRFSHVCLFVTLWSLCSISCNIIWVFEKKCKIVYIYIYIYIYIYMAYIIFVTL